MNKEIKYIKNSKTNWISWKFYTQFIEKIFLKNYTTYCNNVNKRKRIKKQQ